MYVWKLETAKAKLSDLVRRARDEGPQRITVRGKPAVVVLSEAEYDRLTAEPGGETWVDRLQKIGLPDDFEFERNPDTGREIDFEG